MINNKTYVTDNIHFNIYRGSAWFTIGIRPVSNATVEFLWETKCLGRHRSKTGGYSDLYRQIKGLRQLYRVSAYQSILVLQKNQRFHIKLTERTLLTYDICIVYTINVGISSLFLKQYTGLLYIIQLNEFVVWNWKGDSKK